MQAIQDRYSSLDAVSGPDFEVRFEGDTISLVVPEDGICLPNGWSITPLVPPMVGLSHQLNFVALFLQQLHYSNQIEKQQVDEFKPGQRVPYCRLQVTFDKDKKPVELTHKVKLLGTKSPHDFFTITCSPEGKHYSDITYAQVHVIHSNDSPFQLQTPSLLVLLLQMVVEALHPHLEVCQNVVDHTHRLGN